MTKNMHGEKTEVVNDIFCAWQEVVNDLVSYHGMLLKSQHLGRTGFLLMNHVFRDGPQDLSTLAECTSVSKPTITNIVGKLVEHGMVTRVHDPEDRRRLTVDLTPTSRESMERIYFSRDEVRKELAKRLSSEQLVAFKKAIQVLADVVRMVSRQHVETLEEENRFE
ncbi:MAG: MarR family transcriptional regulator [Candidatus Thermoplasmatota archaeon]|nr:MarR family transcriptional regulator [Candidatus Thermoplasmatota archaeon]